MNLRFPDYVTVTRCILLALVIGLLGSEPARAQEGGENDIQVDAGPYQISVSSIAPVPAFPSDLLFLITVLDATTKKPVSGARVRILTSNQADGTEGWALALSGPVAPERYQAEVNGRKRRWILLEVTDTSGTTRDVS